MIKILLFDIDGTLLLTGGCGKVAFERAFEELHGIPDAWGDTVPDGKTDPVIIEEITSKKLGRKLAKKEYSILCKRYLTHFRRYIKSPPCFRLMPGIPKLLKALFRQKDIFLGIASGNLEEAGWLKLKAGKIRRFFKFGGFGSDSAERYKMVQIAIRRGRQLIKKPVHKNNIYVIGDTSHDVRSAKKVGVKSIGVATGTKGRKEFLTEKPDYILKNFSDIQLFMKVLG
jgi:phosphoglycolate phosphatase-like HAD superfamily hydrolase